MWVTTIPYNKAEGELKSHYDRQARALGEPTEMTMVGSLHPPLVAARLDLYAATEKCPSRLTPHQRNLISFVTSAINGTVHCMSQVTLKLRETGMDDSAIMALADDPASVDGLGLSAADRAVVRHAAKLTTSPASMVSSDVEELREAGFSDLEIIDINAQCAHLNYVNRVVMGLGIRSVVDPDFPAYSAIPES